MWIPTENHFGVSTVPLIILFVNRLFSFVIRIFRFYTHAHTLTLAHYWVGEWMSMIK